METEENEAEATLEMQFELEEDDESLLLNHDGEDIVLNSDEASHLLDEEDEQPAMEAEEADETDLKEEESKTKDTVPESGRPTIRARGTGYNSYHNRGGPRGRGIARPAGPYPRGRGYGPPPPRYDGPRPQRGVPPQYMRGGGPPAMMRHHRPGGGPMMRGTPPRHPHQSQYGPPRPLGGGYGPGGPPSHRNAPLRFRGPTAPANDGGPTPLMSIVTPAQVKVEVHRQREQRSQAPPVVPHQRPPPQHHHSYHHQRPPHHSQPYAPERGMPLLPTPPMQQHSLPPPPAQGLKRSAAHFSGYEEPAAKYQPPPSYRSQPPPPVAATPSNTTVVRSNLRQIQCVEDKPVQRPRNTIPTVISHQHPTNSNLRTIPLVNDPPQPTKASQLCRRVRVANLPHSANFSTLSEMATTCGSVKTIQFEGSKAVVEFVEPRSADKFYRMNNGRQMDLVVLQLTKL